MIHGSRLVVSGDGDGFRKGLGFALLLFVYSDG